MASKSRNLDIEVGLLEVRQDNLEELLYDNYLQIMKIKNRFLILFGILAIAVALLFAK